MMRNWNGGLKEYRTHWFPWVFVVVRDSPQVKEKLPLPLRIERDRFYTRPELIEMFATVGIDWDSLRDKIKPRRVHKKLFLGQDILDAWQKAPEIILSRGKDRFDDCLEGQDLREPRNPSKLGSKRTGRNNRRAKEIAKEMKANLGMN